jgi:hypothetical protein
MPARRPPRAPSPVALSTRAERASWSPHDFGGVGDQPRLGRDVPWKEGESGYPVMNLELRIQSYGEYGLRRETRCVHCGRWLSYNMCAPCCSLLRLAGRDDRSCSCFRDSLWIYGHCEDHKLFESPDQPILTTMR